MSANAIAWVLSHASTLDSSERLVLISIANHAGAEPVDGAWEAWPGIALIQREAGLKRPRTVTDALTRLKNKRLLIRDINGAPDGRFRPDERPNLYRIPLAMGLSCDTPCRWCGVSRGDRPGVSCDDRPINAIGVSLDADRGVVSRPIGVSLDADRGVVSRPIGVSPDDTLTVSETLVEPSEETLVEPSGEKPARKPRQHSPVDEDFIVEQERDFADLGDVRLAVDTALNHRSSLKALDKRRYVVNWLRKERELRAERAGRNGNGGGNRGSNGHHAGRAAVSPGSRGPGAFAGYS